MQVATYPQINTRCTELGGCGLSGTAQESPEFKTGLIIDLKQDAYKLKTNLPKLKKKS